MKSSLAKKFAISHASILIRFRHTRLEFDTFFSNIQNSNNSFFVFVCLVNVTKYYLFVGCRFFTANIRVIVKKMNSIKIYELKRIETLLLKEVKGNGEVTSLLALFLF